MKWNLPRQALYMSKIAFYGLVLQCTFGAMLLASPGNGQRVSLDQMMVTIQGNGLSIKKVFQKIESQTELAFSYYDTEIDKNKRVDIRANKQSLRFVLEQVAKQTGYQFKRVNDQLFVKKGKMGEIKPVEEGQKPSPLGLISGQVTSAEDGQPIPGVNILEKGTLNGTTTDFNGTYRIEVSEGATLVFSYIGYASQEVLIGNQTKLDIVLENDLAQLEEVVVVGYGTVRKSDLTGSVAKITSEDLNQTPGGSFDQMLRGRLAGVQITQQSGAPGAAANVNIRGFNSLFGDSQPLYVIDGYPIDVSASTNAGTGDIWTASVQAINPLAQINPEDIESIEVLKDASSTAIYGSRGANGVIMITTKKGKQGTNKITYSNRFELSEVANTYDVLNAEEFIAFQNEAFLTDWDVDTNGQPADEDYPWNPSLLDSILGANADTRWQDEIYQQAVTHNHSLNFTGADAVNRYDLSLNYFDQEGVVINSDFSRINTRLNASRKLSNIVEVGINSNYTFTNSRAAAHSFQNGSPGGSAIIGGIFFRPLDGVPTLDDEDIAQNNPVTVANKRIDDSRITQTYNSIFANIQLMEGLSLRTNGGFNNVTTERNIYMPRGTLRGDQTNGFASRMNQNNSNYLMESNLNFNKTIADDHTINAVAGWSWQEWSSRRRVTQTINFINDVLNYENFGASSSPLQPLSSHVEWGLASFLGRVNYSYKSKYLFTFTSRYDGSTRLGPGNKWDYFPSAAVGWNAHNEPFLEGITNVVSNLKLRTSYGLSGNQTIAVNSLQQLYFPELGPIDGGIETGLVATGRAFANPNLFWEVSKQFDLGADIGLFDDRINIGFDYYSKRSENLLLNQQVGASGGYGSIATNAGKVLNKGIEIEFDARILTGEFGWQVSGNVTRNTNELVEYPVDIILGQAYIGGANIVANQPGNASFVGQPVGMLYGYKVLGIYQNQEQIDNAPLLDSEKAGIRPGDYIYADIPRLNEETGQMEQDSVINSFDRTIIGNPYPDFTFGFNSTFSYHGFTLDVNIQGSIGNEVMNLNQYVLNDPNSVTGWNILRETYENAWRGEGTTNEYRRLRESGSVNDAIFNDRLVEDASFVRLNNIKLTYDFNMSAVKFIDRFSVFVGGRNLLLITDYSGYDPEVSGFGTTAMTQAIDWGTYPNPRTYYTGLNITF